MARWREWVEERSGWAAAWGSWRDSPVAGGARWAHGLGAALGALFLLEAVTGVGLAAYYAPSTTTAWASVNYIQNSIALGWVMRGLHHFGAHAFVIVLALHFLQTLWAASFRSPRELNWVVGLLLMLLALGVSHTGFLLPADQRAYFATQIMLGITGSIPAVGDPAQVLIQGGTAYGNLTLTHLYAAHVVLLPALFLGGLFVHVALVRRNGRTPAPGMSAADAAARTQAYGSGQLQRDVILAAVAVVAVLLIVLACHGAPFDAPADPSQQYPGRPEWYFYPLYELRKTLEGRLEWVATLVIPGVALTALALLPYFDRRMQAQGRDGRRTLAAAVTIGFVGMAGLGLVPAVRDLRDPSFQVMRAQADKDAAEAQRLAQAGVPAQGPEFLYRNDPVVWGARVFAQKCASCHPAGSQKPYKGDPCLDGYASRAWLTAFMGEPRAALFFGNTKIDEMDAWSASTDRLSALVEFLYSQADRPDVDAALAQKGRKVYDKEGCDSCHSLDGKGSGLAPDLKGYAGTEWLAGFIRTPAGPRFYGERNEMDPFDAAKLENNELQALVAYLRAQGMKSGQILSSNP